MMTAAAWIKTLTGFCTFIGEAPTCFFAASRATQSSTYAVLGYSLLKAVAANMFGGLM